MITEKQFISINQYKWEKLNVLLIKKKKTFEEIQELGKLYQKTTEDLSHAQTYFPESELRAYLNHLVRKCHMVFYKHKISRIKKFLTFFSRIFPKTLKKLSIPILVSFILFSSSISISFLMVKKNLELGEIFLSPRTYEMTMRDLELRKKFNNFDNIPKKSRGIISLFIWYNNSMVSIYCFVLGITLGIGTLYILIKNGFMLGALLSIYYMNGHFLDFTSIIMVHGSIELIAIIIAGGAGLNLTGALLFPHRLPRRKKLRANAMTALKALGGVIGLLLIAGLIEGLITTMKLPIFLRIIIAVLNIIFLLLYYIRGVILTKQDMNLQPSA